MYVTMKNVCKPFKSKLSDVLCARYFFKEGIPALLCTEIYGKICGKKWRKKLLEPDKGGQKFPCGREGEGENFFQDLEKGSKIEKI